MICRTVPDCQQKWVHLGHLDSEPERRVELDASADSEKVLATDTTPVPRGDLRTPVRHIDARRPPLMPNTLGGINDARRSCKDSSVLGVCTPALRVGHFSQGRLRPSILKYTAA